MAASKILLYYAFTPLADPEAIRLWQRDLASAHGLRGRILLSEHGINGTIGGEIGAVKRYLRSTKEYPGFRDMDIKWSDGSPLDADGQSADFPKLVVKVRPEIVSFGVPGELRVGPEGVVGGGERLSPEELHALVAERGEDVVFFDGRNAFEAEIGRFRGAVVPDTDTTHDFVRILDSGVYDHLKDSPVVTYCTGGIRCEVLSAVMKDRGFSEVYQLDGGIVRYGEKYGDSGLWDGSLYVFDRRGAIDFTPDAARIGQCRACGEATNRLRNCAEPSCRAQIVHCATHPDEPHCPTHTELTAGLSAP